MLLETQLQRYVLYFVLISFLFISPVLNIIFIPRLAQTRNAKWKYRLLVIAIYVVLLILLYGSVFIYF